MAEYLIQDTTLDAIADAINAKTGGSSAMTPAQMVTAISNITGGETLLGSGTYTLASDSVSMNIPISITGTPKIIFVIEDSFSSAGNQSYAWYVIKQGHQEAASAFPDIGEMRVASTAAILPTRYAYHGTPFSTTEIAIYAYSASIPIRANTYHWYVWG